jgi:Copper resistance protein D
MVQSVQVVTTVSTLLSSSGSVSAEASRNSNGKAGWVKYLFRYNGLPLWFLVGSISNLGRTEYGRLLTIKVCLFIAMVGLAVLNRFRLSPRLREQWPEVEIWGAIRRLRRNSLIELGLGLVLLVIVGALGISMPAIDAMMNGMP